MFRPSDPLLRPSRHSQITAECDDRMLLNPGQIFVNPGQIFAPRIAGEPGELRDPRELLAVAP